MASWGRRSCGEAAHARVQDAKLRCELGPWALGQYVRGEIPREQAVESVGIDWVELAERQKQAMAEDLAWAMGD